MKPKITLGQKLYSLSVGNSAIRCPQILTPVTVVKVGRKYFTAKTDGQYGLETEYALDTWREKTDYTPSSELYETERQWLEEKEKQEICKKLWNSFEYGRNSKNLTIETLRKINELVEPKN